MKSKKIILLLILIFSFNENIVSQTNSGSEWEIIAGRAYGRFHQFGERFVVKSSGETSYFNKSNENQNRSQSGKISVEEINKISEMLKAIDLPAAKKIPDNRYNACLMSPHLPNVYFTLRQNGKSYKLTHCNGLPEKKRDEYTIILSDYKSATYKNLRQLITALFSGAGKENSASN